MFNLEALQIWYQSQAEIFLMGYGVWRVELGDREN